MTARAAAAMVALAVLLILVLLPAVLAAQAAGDALTPNVSRLGARDDRAATGCDGRRRPRRRAW